MCIFFNKTVKEFIQMKSKIKDIGFKLEATLRSKGTSLWLTDQNVMVSQ